MAVATGTIIALAGRGEVPASSRSADSFAPILLRLALHRGRFRILDFHPMCRVRSPSTVAGLINSVHSLRAAVLAAYSAKRNQTSAIWSIIERLRGESIVRQLDALHREVPVRITPVHWGSPRLVGMVANSPEWLGRLANAIR